MAKDGLPQEEGISGRSATIQELGQNVQKFDATSVPLMILGESG
jgi:DNA-binding NtrC family response regulator